jgi:hypothetical protein
MAGPRGAPRHDPDAESQREQRGQQTPHQDVDPRQLALQLELFGIRKVVDVFLRPRRKRQGGGTAQRISQSIRILKHGDSAPHFLLLYTHNPTV